jgi:hypothetical protein
MNFIKSPAFKGVFWLPMGTTLDIKTKDGKTQTSSAEGWYYFSHDNELRGGYGSDKIAADKFGAYLQMNPAPQGEKK